MKFSKEVQIGLTVLGTLLCLYVGIMYLRTRSIFPNSKILYARFSSAEGIETSTRVLVKGYEIGQVQKVEALDSMLSEFLFSISLNRWMQIPKTSVFKIKRNLLGGVTINLELGAEEGIWCNRGDTLPMYASFQTQKSGQILGKSAITPELMMYKVSSLTDSLTSLVGHINLIMRTAIQPHIRDLMQNFSNTAQLLSQFSNTLVALRPDLLRTLENSRKFSDGLVQNNDKLHTILGDVQRISGTLATWDMDLWKNKIGSSIDNFAILSRQLGNLGKQLEQKNGTLGLLLNDTRLYQNMNRATTDLRLLLRDIKANPTRYVNIQIFGGKKKQSPPQKDSLQYE